MTRSVFGVRKRREGRPEFPLWGKGCCGSRAQVPLVPRFTYALQSGSAALPESGACVFYPAKVRVRAFWNHAKGGCCHFICQNGRNRIGIAENVSKDINSGAKSLFLQESARIRVSGHIFGHCVRILQIILFFGSKPDRLHPLSRIISGQDCGKATKPKRKNSYPAIYPAKLRDSRSQITRNGDICQNNCQNGNNGAWRSNRTEIRSGCPDCGGWESTGEIEA